MSVFVDIYEKQKKIYIYVSWLQRGVLQADPAELETVTAEARRHETLGIRVHPFSV